VEYCQGVAAQCESGVYAGPRFCWGVQVRVRVRVRARARARVRVRVRGRVRVR